MRPLKAGKYITYVAVLILLIFSMLLPYSLPKKIALIIFCFNFRGHSLRANKVVGRIYNKFKRIIKFEKDRDNPILIRKRNGIIR